MALVNDIPKLMIAEVLVNIARIRTQRAHPSKDNSSSAARRRRSRSRRRPGVQSVANGRLDLNVDPGPHRATL